MLASLPAPKPLLVFPIAFPLTYQLYHICICTPYSLPQPRHHRDGVPSHHPAYRPSLTVPSPTPAPDALIPSL